MDLKGAYLKMAISLLPRGRAWLCEVDSPLYRLLDGLKEEWIRVHERALRLLKEVDPRTTTELLADWEKFLALPEDGDSLGVTIEQRRQEAFSKHVRKGGQSRSFFIGLAQSLGFPVTITEYRPFVAGSLAGAAISNGPWLHTWRVNAPESTVTRFSAGRSSAGEPLATWGNERLEKKIQKRKPAHTIVLFGYG